MDCWRDKFGFSIGLIGRLAVKMNAKKVLKFQKSKSIQHCEKINILYQGNVTVKQANKNLNVCKSTISQSSGGCFRLGQCHWMRGDKLDHLNMQLVCIPRCFFWHLFGVNFLPNNVFADMEKYFFAWTNPKMKGNICGRATWCFITGGCAKCETDFVANLKKYSVWLSSDL